MMRAILVVAAAASLALAGCAQTQDGAADTASNEAAPPAASQARPAQTPPPAPPKPAKTTVPGGTFVDIALNATLDSKANQTGDSFSAEVIEPVTVDGRMAIPAGSTIHGTVREAKAAKRGAGNATLSLSFDRLELPAGYSTGISASISEQSEGKKKRNAAIIGGSAAGGALLGRIVGKDTKGAVVGSIVGGAIGTGVVLSKEGEQVHLPAGTVLTIQLDNSVQVPRG